MFKLKVKALWRQPEVGLKGYIEAILANGVPVALCSVEKWNMGRQDSLRQHWNDNVKIFDGGEKTVYFTVSEKELMRDGLLCGSSLEMIVPDALVELCQEGIEL